MRFLRWLKWLGVVALLLVAAAVARGWEAFGHHAGGERRARMERSPQWKDGHFNNPQPLVNDAAGMLSGMFHASDHGSPAIPLPVEKIDPRRFDAPPGSGLRITWLGHASALIELDGSRVLTDPMWSERPSPIPEMGPRRWYPPPIALRDLPALDAVVISHDHYDHLDYPTIAAMKEWNTTFIVPLGVGAHLEYWGIPKGRIVELDWWEHTKVRGLDITCTPARHASGRAVFDKDATLWAGYSLAGSKHRVFFSGDTGLFPAMKQIGARLGPFDVTMIETGQYHASWPDWHIGPEGAVQAHVLLRGRVMLPIHWALLRLAYHGWTEPIERVLAEATRRGVRVLTPKPGQSVEPDNARAQQRWWPGLPWDTAQQAPLVSTGVD